MSVKDKLANTIISKLDASGATHGEVFQVAKDVNVAGTGFWYFSLPQWNEQELVEYIPTSMDFVEQYRNIPNRDKSEWSITLIFGLRGLRDDEPNIVNEKNAIETFRRALNDTPTGTFTENGDTYNYVWSANSLTRLNSQLDSGYNMTLVAMTITAITGIGLTPANDMKWELESKDGVAFAKIDLNPISANSGRGIETRSEQGSNDTKGFTIAKRTVWQGQCDLVYDSSVTAHTILLNHIQGATGYSHRDKFTLTISGVGLPVTKDVLIQGRINRTTGTEITMTFTLTEA